jgi:hypothetical protein
MERVLGGACAGLRARVAVRVALTGRALLGVLLPVLGAGAGAQGLSVSQSGSPGYNYPIAVPPGIAGLQPQLGLGYGGGSGPLGHGWSLQGVSLITRCAADRATDGVIRGVSNTAADKLCLDGQRLIQTDAAGVPLAFPQSNDSLGLASGWREYRTEKDSFARIRAYGMAGGDAANGPAYFKVWTKSGQVHEYGTNSNTTSAATITASASKPQAVVWAASRISDTLGNYIDFQYQVQDTAWGSGPAGGPTSGREWQLQEVRYTGRAGQAPANKVVFEYTQRADTPNAAQDRSEGYQLGSKVVSIRRLQAVRTYVNAHQATPLKVKTLKLGYDNGPITKRSRLVSITECVGAAETQCLPATTFEYTAGGNEAYKPNSAFPSSFGVATLVDTAGQFGVLPADFNGDGKTDLLRWSKNAAESLLYFSNGNGSFTLVPNGTGPGKFNGAELRLHASGDCLQSYVSDFNGDGLPDVLRYASTSCSSGETSQVYFSNGDGSFRKVQATVPYLARVASVDRFNCLVQVVNGYCAEPGLNRGWSAGATFYLMDVNGDGFTDIVRTILPAQAPTSTPFPPSSEDACLSSVCTWVYLGDGAGTFAETTTNLANRSVYSDPSSNYLRQGQANYTLDANADGLADLTGLSTRYFQTSAVWMSRGDGNFEAIAGAANTNCYLPLDFNGDGALDCLEPSTAPSGNRLTSANGSAALTAVANFNLTGSGHEMWNLGPSGALTTGVEIVDLNGDGRSDILRWKDDATATVVYLSNGDGQFRVSDTFNLNTAARQLRHSDGTSSFIPGDYLGNGTVQFLRLKTNPSAGEATSNQLYEKEESTPADLLWRVKSGHGLVSELSYVPLSNSALGSLGARYVSDRGTAQAAGAGKVDLSAPIHVVARQVSDSGVGSGRITTEYRYKGLKASTLGHGSLGFREIAQQSPGPNGQMLSVITQYVQDDPYIGMVAQSQTYQGTLDALLGSALSTTANVYCDKTAAAGAESAASVNAPCPTSAKVQRPYLLRSTGSGRDLVGTALPQVTTTNSYNQYGDPLSISVVTSGTALGASQSFTKTTTNEYHPENTAGDNWIIGRLKQATVRNTVPNLLPATGAGSAANASATSGTREPLSVSLSPSALTKTQTTSAAFSASTSVSVTGSPTGALSYSWVRVAGSTTKVSVSGGASATFTASLSANQSVSETFRVTATDAAGRSGSADLVVSYTFSPPALGASISPSPVNSNRSNPGTLSASASVAITGGVAPHTTSWSRVSGSRISVSGGATGSFSASLSWGESVSETFRASVTDAAGQVKTADVTVNFAVSTQPAVSVSPSALSLSRNNPGSVSGTLTASGSGGTAPYTYAWARTTGSRSSASSTTVANPSISASLNWGENFTETWRVTLTDAAGNTATANVNVSFSTPAQPVVSVSPSALSVSRNNPGSASGSLTAATSGGVAPYSYAWTRTVGSRSSASSTTVANPSISASLNWGENFTETWRVTATDAAGNTAAANVNVSFSTPVQPAVSLNPTALTISATAPGTASGSVSASASGGVPPYSYSWVRTSGSRIGVSGTATATFSASVGYDDNFTEAFSLTVTDAAGNTASSAISVNAVGLTPATTVAASPASLSWVSVTKGSTTTRTLTLANTGSAPIVGIGYAISYGATSSIGDHYRSGGTCPSTGGSLGAGANCTVVIAFAANCVGGTRNGTLDITGNFNSLGIPLNASVTSSGSCQ